MESKHTEAHIRHIDEYFATPKKEVKVFERTQTFSPWIRVTHWVRAFAIFFLIFSGFYLAYPFLTPNPNAEPTGFLYAIFRSWHIIIGFLLICVSVGRLYLFLFKEQRMSIAELFDRKVWISQIKFYLLLGPHPRAHGVYNPLQFFSYFCLTMLLPIISITGIVLYYNVYHEGLGAVLEVMFKWVEVLCGGLANVRKIHHITTWLICIFIPVHIYMVVWNANKYLDGGMDSIIGGFRYAEKDDAEIEAKK